jgi:hypothetical protein
MVECIDVKNDATKVSLQTSAGLSISFQYLLMQVMISSESDGLNE